MDPRCRVPFPRGDLVHDLHDRGRLGDMNYNPRQTWIARAYMADGRKRWAFVYAPNDGAALDLAAECFAVRRTDIDVWSESYFGEVYGLPKWEPSAVIRGTDAGWWRANALSAKLENDLEARLEAGGGDEGIGLLGRIFDPSGDEE